MRHLVLLLLLASLAVAANPYQTGKLVDVSDSSSERVIRTDPNSGSTTNVEDVEYRLSVQLGDMIYVGSYEPWTKFSYEPKDMVVNDPVQVRIDGKHMYVRRPNGKDLKTTIIRRIHAKPPDPAG